MSELGHLEEISTLAVQHCGSIVVSTSPSSASTPCEIRIWKTSSGKCTKVCSLPIGLSWYCSVPFLVGAYLSHTLRGVYGFLQR